MGTNRKSKGRPQTPSFASKDDAYEWMEEQVGDPYMDNYRFAFLDSKAEVFSYHAKQARGCCGSFDQNVMVNGRKAMVGCNYGH